MRALVVIAAFAVAFAAPLTTFERPINADCVAITRNDVSLFPQEFMLSGDNTLDTPEYTEVTSAVGFQVDYFPQYKIVTNNIANETYVLYQCGTAPPSPDTIPVGAKVFQVPLTSLSAPETVPYAFVELLGLEDRVHDVSPFVTSPCGQKLLACGREGVDAMSLGNSTLLADTVGGLVDGVLTTAGYEYPKTFAFSAAQDPGPLNRAEWVKFLGLFFNREKFASDVFQGLQSEYNEVKAVAAEASRAADKVPVVAWASHYVYEDEASYQLSFADYKKALTEDAGAAMLDIDAIASIEGVRRSAFSNTTLEFAWDDSQDGSFATQEQALIAYLTALQSADVVIDETYTMDPASYDFESFENEFGLASASQEVDRVVENLPWLPDRRVFRQDGLISEQGGLDWFETAIARPDMVLTDMARVAAAGRGENVADRTYTWLRTIEEPPAVATAAQCERIDSCDAQPSPICPFVSVCGDGLVVLLQSISGDDNAQCVYQACGGDTALAAANTAQMAAPAVILLTVVVVFIEALVNWC